MKYNEYGVPARQSLTARSVADAIRETLAPPRATSCTWLAMNELSRSWRCPIPEMATWEAWSLVQSQSVCGSFPATYRWRREPWAAPRATSGTWLTTNAQSLAPDAARARGQENDCRRKERVVFVYKRLFMARSSTYLK